MLNLIGSAIFLIALGSFYAVFLATLQAVKYVDPVLLRAARRQNAYTPVLEDWICHFTLPPLAYATLLVAGTMLPSAPETALFTTAGAMLVLLFDGIHNAWDAVTFIAVSQRRAEEKAEETAE